MSYVKLPVRTGIEIIKEGFDVKTSYINRFPYNCGYCHTDGTISGDCWCMFPKSLIWSWACGKRLFKNRVAGTYFYNGKNGSYDGIGLSGLGDWDGDTIMKNADQVSTDFKKIEPMEIMLIPGQHMAMYIGEFQLNGRTYNSVEFNYWADWNNGLIPFWTTATGTRYWYKGGNSMGGKFTSHGKLTKWIDYANNAGELRPGDILKICMDVNKGVYGNNPQRKEAITKKFGGDVYNKVQSVMDLLYS